MAFHFNLFFLPQAGLPFVVRAYLAIDLFFLLNGFVMAPVFGRALAAVWREHWPNFHDSALCSHLPLIRPHILAMMTTVSFQTNS